MAADKTIKALIDHIEQSISDFQKRVPGIQENLFNSLIEELKGLSTQSGKVLNSVQNLKLINALKNKIERLIISEGYRDDVKKFVNAFNVVESLNQQYFADFNHKFKPSKTLPIIKEAAIDKTLNDLLSQGLEVNVVDKLYDILNQNVTTGGSYASLTNQLRNHILTNSTGEGTLERYTKTITTDAINQYSAQYHDVLGQDLNFNWGRYIGSNITTTREFCDLLTGKEWVHKTELPEILKGNIDGHQCKLNKNKLPLGMIPGTNIDNFKIRRGGYNCGHQFFWVPDSAVPAQIKANLGKPVTPAAAPVPVDEKPSEAIMRRNKVALDAIEKKNVAVYPDLFNALPDGKMNIATSNEKGAWYEPGNNKIVVGKNGDREKLKYFQDTVIAHETGHAIHTTNEIVTGKKVAPEFKKHFDILKDTINGKEREIEDKIWEKFYDDPKDKNKSEQLGTIMDVLGSLTHGKFGGGHDIRYYNSFNGAEKEIFAHGMSLLKVDNEFSSLTPEFEQVIKLMKDYSRQFLK